MPDDDEEGEPSRSYRGREGTAPDDDDEGIRGGGGSSGVDAAVSIGSRCLQTVKQYQGFGFPPCFPKAQIPAS